MYLHLEAFHSILSAILFKNVNLAGSQLNPNVKPNQILIIEVKRGGFEITDEEVSQVEHYTRKIRKSGVLNSSATIDA